MKATFVSTQNQSSARGVAAWPRLQSLIALAFLVFPNGAYTEDSRLPIPHQFVGVASCASSNCHGGVAPRNRSPVLQNEYITWFKRDKHSQAWKTLLSLESRRIGWQLGIKVPSRDKTCLQCHSTLIPDGQVAGDRFRTEDGVGCESCHGAAGDWIRTHTASDTSHSDNISHGLTSIEKPAERAKTCLSCHQGDQKREFTHRLYGAGHPRLTFELDTYSTIQPAHWLNDTDYQKRKGQYASLDIWFQGQVATADLTLELLKKISQQQPGTLPELSAFTCSSCHHDLTHKQFLKRDYHGRTGQPPLNLAALEMVAVALKPLDAALSVELGAQIEALNAGNALTESIQALTSIQDRIRAQFPATSAAKKPAEVLRALLEYGSHNWSLYYETAEQLAMGIASAHAQLSNNGKRPAALEKIFKELLSYDDFNPVQFSGACEHYLKSLNQ